MSLHYFCFLTTFPSFLHFPTSLVSNCLHQLFGKRKAYKQETEKTFVPGGSFRILFSFKPIIFITYPPHPARLISQNFTLLVLLIIVTYSSRNMSCTFQSLKASFLTCCHLVTICPLFTSQFSPMATEKLLTFYSWMIPSSNSFGHPIWDLA